MFREYEFKCDIDERDQLAIVDVLVDQDHHPAAAQDVVTYGLKVVSVALYETNGSPAKGDGWDKRRAKVIDWFFTHETNDFIEGLKNERC